MTRPVRIFLLVILLLPLLLAPLERSTVALASEGPSPDSAAPLSYNPNSLVGISDGNPAEGITLIEPPQANNRGEARLSYPIEVPQGRNGLEPELSVDYNSANVNGWMGLGWNLRTSTITVDTRWGVPRYDAAAESETFMLDGMQLTPLANRGEFQSRTAEKIFHTRVEGAFQKITRHGSSPAGYWWEVVDKDGTRFFYGGDLESKAPLPGATLGDGGGGGGNIFIWALREVRDLHGNAIKYTYVRVADPGTAGSSVPGYQLYLKSINYTQSNGADGPYTVTFYRDDERPDLPNFYDSGSPRHRKRADVTVDARGGFKMVTGSLLSRIEISFTNELVSRYDFLYEERAFKKTLLRSITQSGADAEAASSSGFTHTFSYFDESRLDNGLYKGFDTKTTSWSTGDDAVAAPLVPLEGQASALSGAVSTGGGAHVYIGFNPTEPTKEFSGGGKIGFNLNTTDVVLALIDLNGDSLPDKVFRKPKNPLDLVENWPVYFRLNRAGTTITATTTFDKDVEIPSLKSSGIGRDTDVTISGGAELYVVANGIYNRAETFTTGSTYFSDVNGDGLPDLVNNGEVRFNHLDKNGLPTFSPNSSETLVPVRTGAVAADGIIANFEQLREQGLKQSPLVDSLRRWEAPYSGEVQITGTVALVKDEGAERAQYRTADGVRVAIQKNDTELWSARIDQDDYLPKTPSIASKIEVQAGDVIYFRVGSVSDGGYDQVAWSPSISYVNVQPAADVNGLDEYVYRAADDFVTSTGSGMFVPAPVTGTLHISGTLSKSGPTSDEVTLLVLVNDKVISTRTLGGPDVGNFPLPPDFKVLANDKVQLRVKVDSPIDVRQLQWNPSLIYVATDPPQPLKDQDGKYLFELQAPYSIDTYPADDLTTVQKTWTAEKDGTLSVMPQLTVKPIKVGQELAEGTVTFTVKQQGKLVGKRTMNIRSGVLQSSSFSVDVKKGKVYFDFSVHDPELADRVTDPSALAAFSDGTITAVPVALHKAVSPGLVGGQYRGWSYLGYNAEGEWADKPVQSSRLTLSGSMPPLDKDHKPDFTGFDPVDSTTAYLFAPLSKENRWRGDAEFAWVSGSQMSSSRLGGRNVSVPSQGDFAGARAVSKMGRTSQETAGFGVRSGSYSTSFGHSYGEVDYVDMNGDNFPDIVSNGRIQYTTPTGGLGDCKNDCTVGGLGYPLESYNDATNIGIGGNPASFKASSSGEVGASGKSAPRGNKSGSQMATLGFSAELGDGTSEVESSLVDMNGDGLPDKVSVLLPHKVPLRLPRDLTLREGEVRVQLNLGYKFAEAELWVTGVINSGSSETNAIGVAGGFNGGIYDFGGGVSLDLNKAQSKRTLADINGDDLPDLLTITGGGLSVALNTGSGFATAVPWTGVPSDGIETTASAGAGGGLYFTIGIGPLCFPTPFCYLIINPGGDVMTSMARQESSLVDMDGDGYPDYVRSTRDNTIEVARNRIDRTNLLQAVARPLGATVNLDYKRDGNTVDLPFSQWVLSKVSLFDGHTGEGVDTQAMTYSYVDPFYSRFEREFYGYRSVIERELDATGATYRSTTSEYANDSFYTAGLLLRSLVQDAAGRPFDEVRNSYSLVDGVTGQPANPLTTTASLFPQLSATTRSFYEGNTTAGKSTTTTFRYDTLGNVSQMVDTGDLGTQDDVQVDMTYASCNTTNVVGVQVREIVSSNGVVLRRSESTVDCATADVTRRSLFLADGQAATTDLSYFPNGNLRQLTQPANLRGQRYQLTYTYDPLVQTYVATITDSFGYTSSATYNPKFGLPTTTTDVNNQRTSYVYDSFGRTSKVTGPYEQSGGPPTISFEYHPEAAVPWAMSRHLDSYRGPSTTIDRVTFIDGLGRTIQTKQNAAIFTGPDTASRDVLLVSGRVNFDFVGRVVAEYYPVTEPLGNPGAFNPAYDSVQPLRSEYDILDRPTRVTEPDNSVTTYAYRFGPDRVGVTQFETTSVDANGVTEKTYYDVRQHIAAVKQFNNGGRQVIWTSYRYDPLGQITEVTDDRLNVTRTGYDNLGRRTSVDTPDTGRTDTVYDLTSNVVARVTPNLRAGGKRIAYDYEFNRIARITYPDFPAKNVSYTYGAPGAADNRAGRLARVVDGSGSEELFYGKLGEVTKETRTVVGFTGAAPGVYTTQYLYDTWGRLQRLTYPDSEVLTYQYDSGGQLRQASGVKGNFSYRYVNRLEYDKFGDRAFLEAGNGVRTTYAYNPTSRLLANLRAGKGNGSPFQNINYTYDAVGNVRSLANEVAVPPASQFGGPTSQTFQYDDLYRLTGASGSYRYAPNKQRTFSMSMAYDTVHNIVSKQQSDEIAQPTGKGIVQKPTTYSQTYVYGSTRPHAATHIGDRGYTYDANGNQAGWTADKGGTRRNIVWDEENRIQSIFDNGQQLRYTYDSGGERVLKKGPQGETAYVNPYYTMRNRQVGTKHIWAGGTRLVSQLVKLDNTLEKDQYFYQPDHLGSSNYVTDANGALYQHSEYFPFGETWIDESSNTQRTPYLFNGKELDEDSGLYYFGARYYDPRTSVWQSADPVIDDYLDGLPDGGVYDPSNLNLYAYVAQNPLIFTDPDGYTKKKADILMSADYDPPTATLTYTMYKDNWKKRTVVAGDKTLYQHIKSDIKRKIKMSNDALASGAKAYTSVAKKVKPASAQWIKANYPAILGPIPKNKSGSIAIRPALKKMRTAELAKITTPGINPKMLDSDVDEAHSRNQNGNTIVSNPLIKNQHPMNSLANSSMGGADRSLKKYGKSPILYYKLAKKKKP